MTVLSASGNGYFSTDPHAVPPGPLPVVSWLSPNSVVPVASIVPTGFTLQNGTPSILQWQAPSDNNKHFVLFEGFLIVVTSETGGALQLQFTFANTFRSGLLDPGAHPNNAPNSFPVHFGTYVDSGTTVFISQQSALTAGAAILNGVLWAN